MVRAPNESELQSAIVQALQALGWTVLELGRWHRQVRCPDCGAYFTPRSGTGSTPGAPDLLVSRTGRSTWHALELKVPAISTLLGTAPAGRLSKEQQELADAGLTVIIHSLEEALAALEGKEDGHAKTSHGVEVTR